MSDPETNTPAPVSTGTSTPSGMFKERRDHRGKGKKARRTKGSTFRELNFSGHTEESKDKVYNLTYNIPDQYTTTTRAIAKHVGRAYKNCLAVTHHTGASPPNRPDCTKCPRIKGLRKRGG